MKIQLRELRRIVREAIGRAPTPDQRAASAEREVKDLMRYLRPDRVERLTPEEWNRRAERLKALAAYMSSNPKTGLDEVGMMLSVFVSSVNDAREMAEFWNRPSFLGKSKWESDFSTALETASATGTEFIETIKKYRRLRDL